MESSYADIDVLLWLARSTMTLIYRDPFHGEVTDEHQLSALLPVRQRVTASVPAVNFEMVKESWIYDSGAITLRRELKDVRILGAQSHVQAKPRTKVYYAYITKVVDKQANVGLDTVNLRSLVAKSPEEVLDAIVKENEDFLGVLDDIGSAWMMDLMRLDSSRNGPTKETERYYAWKLS